MAERTKLSTENVLNTASFTMASAVAASDIEAEALLKAQEEAVLDRLPSYMVKLVGDYRGQYYYFEIIECIRKLLLVCIPVFFDPQVEGPLRP